MDCWRHIVGIIGGLGPYAHLEFERLLLSEARQRLEHAPSTSPRHSSAGLSDQDYPPWILSSIPQTPDRTEALLRDGPSPVPLLETSLRRLIGDTPANSASFAVITCITAHAFLPTLCPRSPLPILDVVSATVEAILADPRFGPKARVGVLATTGTLKARLFPAALNVSFRELQWVTLLDLNDGEQLQEELVMTPIYGSLEGARRTGGGIKSGLYASPGGMDTDRERLHALTSKLLEAVCLLKRHGVDLIVTGCTELPLVLGRTAVLSVPLLDPMQVAAQVSVRIALGDLPLPSAAL